MELGEVWVGGEVSQHLELLLYLLNHLVDRLHDLHSYHVTCVSERVGVVGRCVCGIVCVCG